MMTTRRTVRRSHMSVLAGLALFLLLGTAARPAFAAAGDVVLMPDRDALMGSSIVVWGNTTHLNTDANGQQIGCAPAQLALSVDPEDMTLDSRKVVLRHTDDGGYLCIGLGGAAQFLHAVDDNPVLGKAIDDRLSSIGAPHSPDPFVARLTAAFALAKDFDPKQPRDERGRWAEVGAEAGSATGAAPAAPVGVVPTAAGVAAATTASATPDMLFGVPELVPALREIASRFLVPAGAAATAFLGIVFLPINRSLISEGTLPDAPEYSYHFDQGTGVLDISRQNEDGTKETLFSGRSHEGIFRDEEGNPIGQRVDGGVALDAEAIRGYEARAKSGNRTSASAGTRTDTATDTDEPKLCPDPSIDKRGDKSAGALAYQMYVGMVVNGKPLPIGFGIKMTRADGKPVYFDDCDRQSGTLIEAKGKGFADQLKKGPNSFPWLGSLQDMMDQATRQTEAAKGRPIEWHFAEKEVADYMRPIFAQRYPNISVHYTPPPSDLIGDLERILKGAWDELRYFHAMLSIREGRIDRT